MGYLAAARGPSSKAELAIDWQHPVYDPEVASTDGTTARRVAKALPVEEAYAAIAGDDPRPLLVLRECLTCTGTDDALLTRNADNEKTMLMSRWFHCVKLPPDVLDEAHPFHALFPGSEPAHLFISAADGSNRRDLKGDQARVELWRLMEARLDDSYEDEPDRALKDLAKLLDELDLLDVEIGQAQSKLDAIAEKSGPNSTKFKKAKKKLAELNVERNELLAEAREASDLAFRETERADEKRT